MSHCSSLCVCIRRVPQCQQQSEQSFHIQYLKYKRCAWSRAEHFISPKKLKKKTSLWTLLLLLSDESHCEAIFVTILELLVRLHDLPQQMEFASSSNSEFFGAFHWCWLKSWGLKFTFDLENNRWSIKKLFWRFQLYNMMFVTTVHKSAQWEVYEVFPPNIKHLNICNSGPIFDHFTFLIGRWWSCGRLWLRGRAGVLSYHKVAGSIPLICMSMCPCAGYWTLNTFTVISFFLKFAFIEVRV